MRPQSGPGPAQNITRPPPLPRPRHHARPQHLPRRPHHAARPGRHVSDVWRCSEWRDGDQRPNYRWRQIVKQPVYNNVKQCIHVWDQAVRLRKTSRPKKMSSDKIEELFNVNTGTLVTSDIWYLSTVCRLRRSCCSRLGGAGAGRPVGGRWGCVQGWVLPQPPGTSSDRASV